MHISILTIHAPANYGSNLQAYAMVRMLTSRGHTVEVLNYRPRDDELYYDDITPASQRRTHELFIQEHLPLTPRFETSAQIKEYLVSARPDCVVVGSDAVLRIAPTARQREINRFGNAFWLEWLDEPDGTSRIPSAYFAASCMGSSYQLLSEATRDRMRRCFSQRRYVSVRDLWTKWMIETLVPESNCEIRLSPDPVFWLQDGLPATTELSDELGLPHRYMVFSGGRQCRPDSEWVRRLMRAAHREGLEIVELPDPDGGGQALDVDWTPPRVLAPLEWLTVIQQAAGYVGTRFHPIVCALTGGVPFVAIDQYGNQPPFDSGMNFPSKTFDLCFRLGVSHLVRSPEQVLGNSPQDVIAQLRDARPDPAAVGALRSAANREVDVMLERLS